MFEVELGMDTSGSILATLHGVKFEIVECYAWDSVAKQRWHVRD